ncbi:MAG TPA: hypothetical protein VMD02_03840 [Candidatus Omnitrophota bacterium]|nr:hypothetical protein [Candidatus Omnitrophota bacterium]
MEKRKIISLLILSVVILSAFNPAFAARRRFARVRPGFGARRMVGSRISVISIPERRIIERPVIIEQSTIVVPSVEAPAAVPAPLPVVEAKRVPPPQKTTQMGLAGGCIGGLPAGIAEIRFFEPFGLTATSLRLGAGYADGKDANDIERQHDLLIAEAVYHLNPAYTPGINPYIGGGINFDTWTTGGGSGSIGGEAYFGLEAGTLSSGQLFIEVGYGKVRTGFSPSNSGLSALAGFRF